MNDGVRVGLIGLITLCLHLLALIISIFTFDYNLIGSIYLVGLFIVISIAIYPQRTSGGTEA